MDKDIQSGLPLLEDNDGKAIECEDFKSSRPSIARHFKPLGAIFNLSLAFSLTLNLLLIVVLADRWPMNQHVLETTKYARLQRSVLIPWNSYSEYGVGSTNNTDRTILWESLDTTPGEVALDKKEAIALGLPRAQDFPWNQNHSIYLVNGFHQIHCLRKIHRWVTIAYHNGTQLDNYQHVVHCMDMLRQDILCNADDTPLFSSPGAKKDAGNGQNRLCRSWDKLTTWAQSQSACNAMINETQGVDSEWSRYKWCTEESPFYEKLKSYLHLPDGWVGEKPKDIESIPPYWESFREIEFNFNEYSHN